MLALEGKKKYWCVGVVSGQARCIKIKPSPPNRAKKPGKAKMTQSGGGEGGRQTCRIEK